jgi:S1-C subfamily serine protease
VAKMKPGEEISLRVMHQGKDKNIKVKLEEMK